MVARQIAALLLLGGGVLALASRGRQTASGGEPSPWSLDLGEAFDLSAWDWTYGGPDNDGGTRMADTPRGIRNNNPGNIEWTGTRWQGLDSPVHDGRFMIFKTPEYGIRAFARTLDTYRSREGIDGYGAPRIDTVAEIINRWAPSHENPTNVYAEFVAERLGVSVYDSIDVLDRRPELIAAMIQFENGQQPYSMATISQGIAMA